MPGPSGVDCIGTIRGGRTGDPVFCKSASPFVALLPLPIAPLLSLVNRIGSRDTRKAASTNYYPSLGSKVCAEFHRSLTCGVQVRNRRVSNGSQTRHELVATLPEISASKISRALSPLTYRMTLLFLVSNLPVGFFISLQFCGQLFNCTSGCVIPQGKI